MMQEVKAIGVTYDQLKQATDEMVNNLKKIQQ